MTCPACHGRGYTVSEHSDEHGVYQDSHECEECRRLRQERDAVRAALDLCTAERDAAIAQRCEIEDCGQDGVCTRSPGCNRHWEERNRELVRERDEARAELAQLWRELDRLRSALDHLTHEERIEKLWEAPLKIEYLDDDALAARAPVPPLPEES